MSAPRPPRKVFDRCQVSVQCRRSRVWFLESSSWAPIFLMILPQACKTSSDQLGASSCVACDYLREGTAIAVLLLASHNNEGLVGNAGKLLGRLIGKCGFAGTFRPPSYLRRVNVLQSVLNSTAPKCVSIYDAIESVDSNRKPVAQCRERRVGRGSTGFGPLCGRSFFGQRLNLAYPLRGPDAAF